MVAEIEALEGRSSSSSSSLAMTRQDVELPLPREEIKRDSWEYVIDPRESAPTLLRIDPPDCCLCSTCVMNTPKSLDLLQRMERWKVPFRGDWKTQNADPSNTLLVVVSLFGVRGSTHFCLTLDETISVGELNSVITKSARTCPCCDSCELSPLPLVLFLNNSNVCITPWGEDLRSSDLLGDVMCQPSAPPPITLGMILHKIGAIRARKCLEWNNLQIVHRVLWIEAYSLPIIESNSSPTLSLQCLPSFPSSSSISIIHLSGCVGHDLEIMVEKNVTTLGEKKLLEWFQRTSKHICHSPNTSECKIECSPHRTPLAFAWYQWAKTQLLSSPLADSSLQEKNKNKNKNKKGKKGKKGGSQEGLALQFEGNNYNNLLHLISTAPLSTLIKNTQWTDVASLAYEYYVILHLANHLFQEFSSASCQACSSISSKKLRASAVIPEGSSLGVDPSSPTSGKIRERGKEGSESLIVPPVKKKARRKRKTAVGTERQKQPTPSDVASSSTSAPSSLFWIGKDELEFQGEEETNLHKEEDDEEGVEMEMEDEEDISEELEAFERLLRVHEFECPRRQLPKWLYNNIQQVMSSALEARTNGATTSPCDCPCHH